METLIPKEELDVFASICNDFEVVIDVGARTDTDMHRIHPCEYHLFEPNPSFADRIQKIDGVTVNRYGLGDRDETLPYFPDIQSFSLMEWRGNQGESYDIKTLDWYVKEKGITKIDFLKIDTEGYDYKVLLGGKHAISMTRYIQFEYWDGVRKFVDLLPDFDMFLITEPKLLQAIDRQEYKGQLVPLDEGLIDYIDNTLITKKGAGGNILCKRK